MKYAVVAYASLYDNRILMEEVELNDDATWKTAVIAFFEKTGEYKGSYEGMKLWINSMDDNFETAKREFLSLGDCNINILWIEP